APVRRHPRRTPVGFQALQLPQSLNNHQTVNKESVQKSGFSFSSLCRASWRWVMTSLSSTQNYGDLLTGSRLQRLLKNISAGSQPKIQPMLADNQPLGDEKYAVTGLRLNEEGSELLIRISGKPEFLSQLAKSHLI